MKSKYIKLKNDKEYEKIKPAADSIKKGDLVLFPTETVYGIGANALDEKAVKDIFVAKGRAQDNPLIVHIANTEMVNKLAKNIGEIEQKLMKEFWPGPFTIVLEKTEIVPSVITGGLDTVAIRMPSNVIARKLIEYSGCPIAAPSANISGKPSGTLVEDIIDELDGKVDYIIDTGKVDIGVESTVVRVVDGKVHILRPGKITTEDIEKLGIEVLIEKQILGEYKNNEKVMSPGIKYKHYAPTTKCVLIYSKDEEKLIKKIKENIQGKKAVVICKTQNIEKYNSDYRLDMGETLEEITNNIFTLLRKADRYNAEIIAIEGVRKRGVRISNNE